MSKLFISVRITESFFTPLEMKTIKKELKNYTHKSDFVREAIKNYIHKENKISSTLKSDCLIEIDNNDLKELKEIAEKNQQLLNQIVKGNLTFEDNDRDIYKGEEQKSKTNQILNLLEQF
ncbi:hypothetical protein [Orenia marismortui]|uniref:hypothetical protein n=1 Tax=Orenia marismortui TaxID=46469 RepID=UPI0003782D25|nr:hypothetical protein [Orenia marismortui]